jgi:hypothetical protein
MVFGLSGLWALIHHILLVSYIYISLDFVFKSMQTEIMPPPPFTLLPSPLSFIFVKGIEYQNVIWEKNI